ncbi:MAG: GntR family transcriptional regulator [Candidatus Dormibacteraceae bacterium]
MSGDVKTAPDEGGAHESAQSRIERHLRRLITEGQGLTSPLPSEQSLADRFGVSRMTARAAYQRLAGSGFIVRYPARGSFVAPHVVEDLTDWGQHSFFDRWRDLGIELEVRILAYDTRPAPAEVCADFGVRARTRLTYLERLRVVRGMPLSLDRMYMLARIHRLVDEQDLAGRAVAHVLPDRGVELVTGDTEISARSADASEAAVLGIRSGDIVLAKRTLDRDIRGALVIAEVSVSPAARVGFRIRTTFQGGDRRAD